MSKVLTVTNHFGVLKRLKLGEALNVVNLRLLFSAFTPLISPREPLSPFDVHRSRLKGLSWVGPKWDKSSSILLALSPHLFASEFSQVA